MDSFAAPSPIADSTDDGEEEAVLREIFEMCDADEDGIVEVDPNASRAERRRAERSNRKNASKKKKRR